MPLMMPVVLDLSLPHIDGMDILKFWRKQGPR
ncbi:Uncharacterised protein [Providencia alcalifaciens]|nr:Uncharacterised protein [Providencia alcalifaciens]